MSRIEFYLNLIWHKNVPTEFLIVSRKEPEIPWHQPTVCVVLRTNANPGDRLKPLYSPLGGGSLDTRNIINLISDGLFVELLTNSHFTITDGQ